MNDENNPTNFYSDNENLNPNPDFKNLLKIPKTDILKKDNNLNGNGEIFNYNKKKKLSHRDLSTDEKSYSNESHKTIGSFLINQNTKTINFDKDYNALTGSNFELNNKQNAEELKFNLSQLKIENGDKINSKEIQAKNDNADITFENNNSNDINNSNNLENFVSFTDNNNKTKNNCNEHDLTFSNERLNKEEFSILNSHVIMPNNNIMCESNEKIKKDEKRNIEKESDFKVKFANFENPHSPRKKEKLMSHNDSLYQRFFSSCKNNKGKNNEISESERKFNLELIDNMNFSIAENLLANDSIIISNFNEMENGLENKWEKILKEIEDSHVVESSEADFTSHSIANGYDDLKNVNESLQQNMNNSHVLVNFDPVNHSLHSFYDIHLDKDEYEKFLALDSKEKQAWLIKYKKEIYDIITNKNGNLNISNLLNEKKRKTNSNNNLTRLRKRKSLLEIYYCHIEFDQNETYDGEKLDVNSTSINGYGIYKYKNGDVYEGDFVEGKRHGLGEYIYKDNSYYRGEWENDFKSGRGVYSKNGKEFNGIWKENNFISGFVFEIKNLKVDESKPETSFSISNSENYLNSVENVENSACSIEEEYLDIQQINDFFKDYGVERINSNFSYAEFLQKYKAIQKEYLSNILMTNYDFLSNLKVETEIHLNDIIFNQKSIFKKFFNNNLSDIKENENTDQSNNELSFSFANHEPFEKLNIEDLIFFSDCPMEETTHDFSKIYKLDFTLKCDCKKIRNFISHFC